MSDKQRERKYDKEKHKKKKLAKKRRDEKRKAQAVGREKRKYVRQKIKPYYEAFRDLQHKHLLFVLKDTDNMEKVLFQKNDLGHGVTLLTLPYITKDMIEEYLDAFASNNKAGTELSQDDNARLNGLMKYWFSVNANEQKDLPEVNMMVFRNCKVFEKRPNLVALNVRPYDLNTWYSEETTTVGNGTRVFKGEKLNTFFHIEGNLGNTYVFQDTITELLLYKSMMGKIEYNQLQADHFSLAKRHFLDSFKSIYLVLATDEDELFKRFSNEEKETRDLDGIEEEEK